jgi:hypothetical protein
LALSVDDFLDSYASSRGFVLSIFPVSLNMALVTVHDRKPEQSLKKTSRSFLRAASDERGCCRDLPATANEPGWHRDVNDWLWKDYIQECVVIFRRRIPCHLPQATTGFDIPIAEVRTWATNVFPDLYIPEAVSD